METHDKEERLRELCNNIESFLLNRNKTESIYEELKKYLDDDDKYSPTLEKAKLIARILRDDFSVSNQNVEDIINYLKPSNKGWFKGKYYFQNSCFNKEIKHCRNITKYISTKEFIEKGLNTIFFDKEYGALTLYIFAYCLSGLFTSLLKADNVTPPFFLQISNNENVYQLVKEIVTICDVNYGFINKCQEESNFDKCYYNIQNIIPRPDHDEFFNDELFTLKDVPVIIDGTTKDKRSYYDSLLRIISAKKNVRLSINVMPVFVTNKIVANYKNFINIDLSDFTISSEYLSNIKTYKNILSSFVLNMVKNYTIMNKSYYKERDRCNGKYLAYYIKEQIRLIQSNSHILSEKDSLHISILFFYISRYFEAIKSFLNPDEKFQNLNCVLKRIVHIHYKNSNATDSESLVQYIEVDPDLDNKDIKIAAVNNGIKIQEAYAEYKVYIKIVHTSVRKGKTIYDIKILENTKYSDLNKYSENVTIKLELKNKRLHISQISNKIKVCLSDDITDTVQLTELLKSSKTKKYNIPYIMGTDITGNTHIADISELPHLLIGGSSGSGKSIAVHCLMTSIITQKTPDIVNLILIDMKGTTLSLYNEIPHLIAPVIAGIDNLHYVEEILSKLKDEMTSRYEKLKKNETSSFPYIVCIIEECQQIFVDSKDKIAKKIKTIIESLLNQAREAKIHIILIVQDPAKENMTFKMSNITSRIALKTANYHQSKLIINEVGAENLQKKGEMIYNGIIDNTNKFLTLQGAYISNEAIKAYVEDLKGKHGNPNYLFNINTDIDSSEEDISTIGSAKKIISTNIPAEENLTLLATIIFDILSKEKFTTSYIKEKYRMGYSKANKYAKKIESWGIIGEAYEKCPREIFPKKWEDLSRDIQDILNKNYTKVQVEKQLSLPKESTTHYLKSADF